MSELPRITRTNTIECSFSTIKEATAVIYGLSYTKKMPGASYGLPASACLVGGILAMMPGTTCSKCYAKKGHYRFNNVKIAQRIRLQAITNPKWSYAMAHIINSENQQWFRWHDSGDLQGVWHLLKIIEVANLCPNTQFWLPTSELKIVKAVHGKISIPKNLVIRISAAMIDGDVTESYPHTSSVTLDEAKATCPATKQGGQCGWCRNCWDAKIPTVTYLHH